MSKKESLREFYEKNWSTINPNEPFRPGWHIYAIFQHLEALTKGKIPRLIISGPPGIGFTSLCAIAFPVWLERFITLPIVVFELKEAQARRNRAYQKDLGSQNLKEAGIFGGESLTEIETFGACLVNSTMSFRDAEDAEYRDAIYQEMTHLMQRADGPLLVFGPRSHEDDPTGRLLRTGEWDHLVLPALYEADRVVKPTSIGWVDPRKLEDDELPCCTIEDLARLHTYLGREHFDTCYQQRPLAAPATK